MFANSWLWSSPSALPSTRRLLGERECLFVLFIAALCATSTCPPAASHQQYHLHNSSTAIEKRICPHDDDLISSDSTSSTTRTKETTTVSNDTSINNNHINQERNQDGSLFRPNFAAKTKAENPFYSLDDYLPEISNHPHLKLPLQPEITVSNPNLYHHHDDRQSFPQQHFQQQPHHYPQDNDQYHHNHHHQQQQHRSPTPTPVNQDVYQKAKPIQVPTDNSNEQLVLQQYVAPIEVRQVIPSSVQLMSKQMSHPMRSANMQHEVSQQQILNDNRAKTPQNVDEEAAEVPSERPLPTDQSVGRQKKIAALKITPIFKPSILKRPKIVNLTAMLKPGQVILAEKATSIDGQTSSALGPVRAEEIVNMLQRLQSFAALKESEKAKADDDGYDNDNDDDDKQKSNTERNSERVLPTAHLFGSVGSINENKVGTGTSNRMLISNKVKSTRNEDEDDDDEDNDERRAIEQRKQAEMAEDLMFLKSLADFGTKLKDKRQQELELRPLDADYYGDDRRGSDARASNEYKQLTNAPGSIPIDVLVDHLMSSSRLASFGVQHTGVRDPNGAETSGGGTDGGVVGEDDDDDEEEEEEDGSSVPSEEEEAESTIRETKLTPTNRSSISFNAVMNRSDTWIPLDSVVVKNKQLLRDTSDSNHELGGAVGSHQHPMRGLRKRIGTKKKKRKKKKKKKRKKRGNGELVLVIGDKVLSRRDLIRLIKVLNKMASQREHSKEREASRRLLRFLVKLALEEYKKNEVSSGGSAGDKNDPIKEVLRSVLLGPVYGKDWSANDKDGSIQLKPLSVERLKKKKDDNDLNEAMDNNNIESDNKPSKKPVKKKLDQLSDDLEMYFESDFFEDLADKSNVTNKKPDSHRTKKLRRASRAGYSLPVPIYGKQQIEASDEDDVDLDHVRIQKPTPKVKIRESIGTRKSEKDKEEPTSSTEEEEAKVAAGGEKNEQPKTGEEEKPEEEDPEEQQVMDEKSERTSVMKRRRAPEEQPTQPVVTPKELASDESDEPSDSNDDDDEDPEVTPDEAEKSAADDVEDELNQDERNSNEKKKVRRKRRRKSRFRGAKAESSIHPYDRYEIPAPILAGKTDRVVVKHLKKQENRQNKPTNSTETAKSTKIIKKKSTNDESSPASKRKQLNKAEAKTKAKSKDKTTKLNSKKSGKHETASKKAIGTSGKNDSKKSATAKKDRKRRDRPESETRKKKEETKDPDEEFKDNLIDPPSAELEEPKEPPRDMDYFNEGTSYSKVCEDDGQCKVSVQSSSPKLRKAIKARDKPTIVKHLGKWISKDE